MSRGVLVGHGCKLPGGRVWVTLRMGIVAAMPERVCRFCGKPIPRRRWQASGRPPEYHVECRDRGRARDQSRYRDRQHNEQIRWLMALGDTLEWSISRGRRNRRVPDARGREALIHQLEVEIADLEMVGADCAQMRAIAARIAEHHGMLSVAEENVDRVHARVVAARAALMGLMKPTV